MKLNWRHCQQKLITFISFSTEREHLSLSHGHDEEHLGLLLSSCIVALFIDVFVLWSTTEQNNALFVDLCCIILMEINY